MDTGDFYLGFLLVLVGAAPDAHLLGILDQLLTEIGMGDADDLLGTLPSGQALHVDHTVLGDDVVHAGTGIGGDGAGGQGGDDAALQGAVLAHHGGGHTDEALAALGQVSAQSEVQLAAGTGDVLHAGRLGIDLTKGDTVFQNEVNHF